MQDTIQTCKMSLINITKQSKDILKPFGHTDVILYYAIVASKLQRFLKGKELCSKIWIPKADFQFLKRGSKEKPLFIEDLNGVDDKFMQVRKEITDLKKAMPQLNKKQQNVWNYFVPRKLMDLFYATNNEGAGKPMERIFIDIDRKGLSAEHARRVTKGLVAVISKDKELKKLISFNIFVMWTGSSFHVYLMLKKPITHAMYDQYIAYSKKAPLDSFIGRWADIVAKKTGIKVIGGHQKIANAINLDPSQTPSGKLCRAPFSLHMKDALTIDGVAIPLTVQMLDDAGLVKKLQAYTPDKVVKELALLSKRLP